MLWPGGFTVRGAACVLVDNLPAPVSISKSGQYVQRRELHVCSVPAAKPMPIWGAGSRWSGV